MLPSAPQHGLIKRAGHFEIPCCTSTAEAAIRQETILLRLQFSLHILPLAPKVASDRPTKNYPGNFLRNQRILKETALTSFCSRTGKYPVMGRWQLLTSNPKSSRVWSRHLKATKEFKAIVDSFYLIKVAD